MNFDHLLKNFLLSPIVVYRRRKTARFLEFSAYAFSYDNDFNGYLINFIAKLDKPRSNLFANFVLRSSDGFGKDFHKLKPKTILPLFEPSNFVKNLVFN